MCVFECVEECVCVCRTDMHTIISPPFELHGAVVKDDAFLMPGLWHQRRTRANADININVWMAKQKRSKKNFSRMPRLKNVVLMEHLSS